MSDSRMGYYDRQGKPMTMDEWLARKDTDYAKVAYTELPNGMEVETRWVGMAFTLSGEPRVFETRVFSDGPLCNRGEAYSSEVEALAGHERWVSLAGLAVAGQLHPEGSEVAADVVRLLRERYGYVPGDVLELAATSAVRVVVSWQFVDWGDQHWSS